MGREKLQKYIFVLLLVLLPTQLGLHFWPEWSYVSGVRVDYFSPTLYLTDILVLGLFLFWMSGAILEKKYQVLRIKYYGHKGLFLLILLTLFILSNVYFSLSPFVSAYKWLKVAEFGFLVYFVSKKPLYLFPSLPFLLVPVFYESVLAIWQFVNQSSIGGLWYFLGERTFDSSTAGIANAVINGQLVLRPYGTLPHPNVLTGFLVVCSLLVLPQFTHISRKITAGVLGLAVLVVFLTPSRGDLFHGLQLRNQLNNLAIQQFNNSPLIGTGLGTSPLYPRRVQNYALVHQPIHNIYLLVLSETGVVGLVLFLFLIYSAVRKSVPIIRNTFSPGAFGEERKLCLYIILFLGLFDHYFLTLQQGQLLLALTVGLALATMSKAKNREVVNINDEL